MLTNRRNKKSSTNTFNLKKNRFRRILKRRRNRKNNYKQIWHTTKVEKQKPSHKKLNKFWGKIKMMKMKERGLKKESDKSGIVSTIKYYKLFY